MSKNKSTTAISTSGSTDYGPPITRTQIDNHEKKMLYNSIEGQGKGIQFQAFLLANASDFGLDTNQTGTIDGLSLGWS